MIRSLIACALALSLAACSTTGGGGVTLEKDKVTGMDSRDAAWATATKSYHDAAVSLVKEQKPACELKAAPGQSLKIEGLESFSCYGGGGGAQASAAMPAPAMPKTAFAENVGAAADGAAKVLGAATPLVAINAAADALGKVVDSNTATSAGAIGLGGQGINRKPDVFITNTTPEGASMLYPQPAQ